MQLNWIAYGIGLLFTACSIGGMYGYSWGCFTLGVGLMLAAFLEGL